MRQSIEAKKAWTSAPRLEDTIFPFRSFPPLLEFFERTLPRTAHISLIGGGKGHLAYLLANTERTFVSIDIVQVDNPVVPLVVADFEQPLPDVRKSGKELSALAAFSLEYGDIALATANIADLLSPGERFIFVCHHSDSPFLTSMKSDKKMFELINAALKKIAYESREEWLWRCRGLEIQMRKLFSDEKASPGFPDFGHISECDLQTFLRYQQFWDSSKPPLSIGLHAVLTLRLGYENPHLLNQVLGSFGPSWDALREHVEFAAPLLEKKIRDPKDILQLVDSRFRLINGIGLAADTEETHDIVCFALAFQKS